MKLRREERTKKQNTEQKDVTDFWKTGNILVCP